MPKLTAERHTFEKLSDACDSEILNAIRAVVQEQGGVVSTRDPGLPSSPVDAIWKCKIEADRVQVCFSTANGLGLLGPESLVSRLAHRVRARLSA